MLRSAATSCGLMRDTVHRIWDSQYQKILRVPNPGAAKAQPVASRSVAWFAPVMAKKPRTWPWWLKVRLELAARGMSQREAARHLKKPVNSFSRWLKGENTPTDPALLQQIADWFGWTVRWMLDESRPYGEAPTVEAAKLMAESLPPEARRVVYALADVEKMRYLAECLDRYEAWQRRARGEAPQAPLGSR